MATLSLRVKHKGVSKTLDAVPEQATVAELQAFVAEATGVQPRWQLIKVGFPPKEVPADAGDRKIYDLGCRNRDTVVLEERAVPLEVTTVGDSSLSADAVAVKEAVAASVAKLDLPPLPMPERVGDVERHIIEADNSCLFNSIAYLLRGKSPGAVQTPPQDLRELVAAQISADAEKWDIYTLAESQKPSLEYVEWIRKSDSWGGSIELNVLSEVLGVQLSAVCIRSLRVEHFPHEPGPIKHRIFLMYDGIHYDAVVAKASSDGSELRVFDPADDLTLSKIVGLALELQEAKQFTNVADFTLECQHCFKRFKGEPDAQVHGKETGHFNFQEVGS